MGCTLGGMACLIAVLLWYWPASFTWTWYLLWHFSLVLRLAEIHKNLNVPDYHASSDSLFDTVSLQVRFSWKKYYEATKGIYIGKKVKHSVQFDLKWKMLRPKTRVLNLMPQHPSAPMQDFKADEIEPWQRTKYGKKSRRHPGGQITHCSRI